jgi:acid phosphatase (class A)
MKRILVSLTVIALMAAPAFAADAPAVAPAAAPAKTMKFLTPAQLTPQLMLPAPPADSSAEGIAELDEVRTVVKTASAERHAQAQWDNDHEDLSAFAALVPGLDPAKLPATKALFDDVVNESSVGVNFSKTYFARKRPFQIDPSIAICKGEGGAKPTSYPSGHTTLGFTMAVVMSDLFPDKAQAIFVRAQDYGYSRLVCGVHFRSDTVASQVLGTYIGKELLENAAFHKEVEAARAELKAAGLTH